MEPLNNQKPYGFIYKTVLPDQRYYIGQHKIISHQKLDPTYFGSGVIIKDYIKSKGVTGIVREILEYGYSHDEMNLLETKYITNEVLSDPLNINLDTGGRNKYSRTVAVCKKIGKTISLRRKENPDNWPKRTGANNNKSINWKLISPTGEEFYTCGNLRGLCNKLGISVHTMKKAYREGWIPNRGICAGWRLYNMDSNQGTYRTTNNHGVAHSGVNNPAYKHKLTQGRMSNDD